MNGRVVRLSADIVSPVTVWMPASPAGSAALWLPLLGLSVLIILLQAVLWPIRQLVRRKFGAAIALQGVHLAAYRGTGLFAWGVVFAVAGWVLFVVTASGDATMLGGPLDWLLNTLLIVLPLSAVGLALAAAAHLILSFGQKRSWFAHIGRLLLLLSAMVLIWIVFSNNLYGFGLQF